jgi:hypothetical protein
MTVTYTFDVLCTLDGYGSYRDGADWGGYWGKQGPEFLDGRRAVYGTDHRLVLGAAPFGCSRRSWAAARRSLTRVTRTP